MGDLIAKRSFKYATRQLVAGEVFQAKSLRDERLLIAIKRAERPNNPPPAADDLSAIRKEYVAKFGKRPFNGWNEAVLRSKIDEG